MKDGLLIRFAKGQFFVLNSYSVFSSSSLTELGRLVSGLSLCVTMNLYMPNFYKAHHLLAVHMLLGKYYYSGFWLPKTDHKNYMAGISLKTANTETLLFV